MSKPSGDLKKFLDTKKTETKVLGPIERHLLTRPPSDRKYDVIHPSDMAKEDWCHRAQGHLLLGKERKAERVGLRLQSIFDEGHFIHAKWQKWLSEMGVLYGRWICDKCQATMASLTTTPGCVLHFYDSTFTYAEVPLINKDLRIAGHTDGWVKNLGEDFLIEIKSIGPGTIRNEAPQLMAEADGDLLKAWKAIRRPFKSHMMQGQIYLELARRAYGDDAPKEIVFIYELKLDQSYQEFVVKARYEYVAELFDAAEEIVKAAEKGEVLPCNINPEKGCKSCKPYEEE